MSADILPFLKEHSFDPEMTSLMGAAYDKIIRTLHDRGQPAIVHEVIALKIIEVVRTGERDVDKICQRVLTMLGLPAEACADG